MRKVLLLSLLLAIGAVAGGFWYFYGNLKVNISIPPQNKEIAAQEMLNISVQTNREAPATYLELYLEQNEHKISLYNGTLKTQTVNVLLNAKKAGLKDGPAQIVGILKLPFKEEKIFEETVYIDTTPPVVTILQKPRRLTIGEPGVITVKVSPDTKSLYLEVGKARFPLLAVGNETYKTVFTAPLFLLKKPANFFVVAVDKAGNSIKWFVPITLRFKKFRTVKINLSKKTLQTLVLKYFPNPDNLVEKFNTINTEFRKEDQQKLLEICSHSEAQLMAHKAFLQLPGSAPTAYYGDHRYYFYNGKLIGESIHKGLDLAKYHHAPVVAANDGKVVFVGQLKVYGNTIVIDHGYGVFTLYGHLNDFTVAEGQTVKKGQVIGYTDTTGLAFGDHLHFGVLIWGYAANPIFFLDGRYLNYYFYNPLKKTSS